MLSSSRSRRPRSRRRNRRRLLMRERSGGLFNLLPGAMKTFYLGRWLDKRRESPSISLGLNIPRKMRLMKEKCLRIVIVIENDLNFN
jgi:hypothetical protein